uniref:Actin-binding protein anillin n=1 Tax=Aceria tosichella TaxID=561515 RepID=A0A6G1SMG2_9ACAR
MNTDENIEDWVQKLKERAEKRQEKLYPKEQISIDASTICSEPGEVSYPPLSPLKEEESVTSELNYSSDLSLTFDGNENGIDNDEDGEGDTTATNFYRAEPVVCHSSPDRQRQQVCHSSPDRQHKQPSLPTVRAIQHQPTKPLQERHELASNEQLMRDLSKKIERADSSIKQLSKAVTYSKIGTKEHIEAARLLKIAQVELHDFRLHKHKLDNGLGKKADSLGSLRLYNIGFETKSALKEDLALEGVFHYFFCIASCGPEVKATETVDTDNIRAQKQKDYILFKEELIFTDLPPDFIVELQVFEYVKKHMKFVERTLEALSTPKKSRPTLETEFHRVGFIKLTKEDRKSDEPKTLKFENGSKYINKRFRFQMQLNPEKMPSKAGMLHVRRLDSNGRPDWLRFWIDLSEGRIRFWKSKQDALDKMRPEQQIELKDLCSETVQKLTPDDDLYRQNSFVLYERDQRRGGESDSLFQRILDDGSHKIIKHQFAADNKEDRDSWCALLDKSMHSFREWNGKTNVHTVDEFKELFSR